MVSKFRQESIAVPTAMRLPYPLVEGHTLQAGEYGGWLGVNFDPTVVRTPNGEPFGGVSRDPGNMVVSLTGGIERARMKS